MQALIERRFSVEGQDPLDAVKWESRKHGGRKDRDRVIEVPATWSDRAGRVVADKYMRGIRDEHGTVRRETSVRQVLRRVCGTVARWAVEQGTLDQTEADIFRDELLALTVGQYMAFNSPVWFNVGVSGGKQGTEQCSACFINSVGDNMEDILDLGVREGRIYKHGSGSGVNYSSLRSSHEDLSTTGTASGPVPFIDKDDRNAGAIKSGGTTRRAAKMVILNADHGDIIEFVCSKQIAERAAKVLVAAGFDKDFRARLGAYGLLPFQNGNHSVRVTEEFMQAVAADGPWNLLARDGKILQTIRARVLWDLICIAAYECGCPGLQFDSVINGWHTCPNTARINASNPCSEYMFLDDSACNLASLNLRRFQREDGTFDIDAYEAAIDVTILAQEVIVDGSSYPTARIARNSRLFRPLGLGFANLGSALMCAGLAYDSPRGRELAAGLTALMGGRAYRMSARIAQRIGPFEGWRENREPMAAVMKAHHAASSDLLRRCTETGSAAVLLAARAEENWHAAHEASGAGFRNSQVTVLAPTGTISFMMDCDTTGVEPDIALNREKHLVGGGTEKMVSLQVPAAMRLLGYDAETIARASAQVVEKGSVYGVVLDKDLSVFDCALEDPLSGRCVSPEGHVDMMAALQPFLSGAISKTVNMPNEATVQQVSALYLRAWRSGVKAIAIYRDGCKASQPVTPKKRATAEAPAPAAPATPAAATPTAEAAVVPPTYRPMPNDVPSVKHKVKIGEVTLHIHAGFRTGDRPEVGEVYIRAAKQGTIVNGLLEAFGILLSKTLQHGVPLDVLVEEFRNSRFEPSGFTGNERIPRTTSIVDYLFRFLESQQPPALAPTASETPAHEPAPVKSPGEPCPDCGASTIRTGACRSCPHCFWAGGCG